MKSLKDKLFRPGLVALILLLLFVVSLFQGSMNKDRASLGLTRLTPLENAPPVLAFTTVALGGFRGLIANALWMRASDLQEEGKYFEMVQLSDWITKLQPKITTVWYHLAWNMAYNISVKFQDHKDRWQWVQKGIELLRDEGLVYNPKETLLYRELSWFFQHKMGQDLDDAHLYYKGAWIQLMEDAVGKGPQVYQTLMNSEDPEDIDRLRKLRENFRLDPEIMVEVDEQFGPLDWRLPETHAIYWAYLGLEVAKEDQKMTLRRSIYQSMQLAFQRGRLIENEFTGTYEFGPNLNLIDKVNSAYELMKEEQPDMADHIGTGHRNFLREAVYFLYTHSRMTEAQEWFSYLKELYPEGVPQGMTLDEYAVSRVTEVAGDTSSPRTISVLQGLVSRSYYLLAIGEDDQATGHMDLARTIHTTYNRKVKDNERVAIPEFDMIRTEILNNILNSQADTNAEVVARLKSALGLPSDFKGQVKVGDVRKLERAN